MSNILSNSLIEIVSKFFKNMTVSIRLYSIIYLVIFSLFYSAVGLFYFLFQTSLDGQDDQFFTFYNMKMIFCFVTAVNGVLVLCSHSRNLKIVYLLFLITGIVFTCINLSNTANDLTEESKQQNKDTLKKKLEIACAKNDTVKDSFGYYLNDFQGRYKCCGVDDKKCYGDINLLPLNCCEKKKRFGGNCRPSNAYEVGCWKYFNNTEVEDYQKISFYLSIAAIVAQLLSCGVTINLIREDNIFYYK